MTGNTESDGSIRQVRGICSLNTQGREATVNEGSKRELTLTFDVEGNWYLPAAIDFSERELDLLADVTDAVAKHGRTP